VDRGYDQQRDDWVDTEDYASAYMNSLVRIADSQTHGALEGVGAGVIAGGVVASGAGLFVTVAAFKAILDTTHGMVYLETDGAIAITALTPSETLYIYAGAVWGVAVGDEDSRETATPLMFFSDSNAEADALLLASVVTGPASVTSVTDLREFSPAQEAALGVADLATIKSDLGPGYWSGGVHVVSDSISARLDAIEGGGGTGYIMYWGTAWKGAGDNTTIEQEIDTRIAAALAGVQTGSGGVPVADYWDEDAVRQAKTVLALVANGESALALAVGAAQVDAVTVVWGIYGDGTGSTPNFIDVANSTWLPDLA
jgi:hypothetical protein